MNEVWTRIDSAVVGFFNPLAADPAARASVRNGWAFHRLDHVVYVATAYVAFVLACKFLFGQNKNAKSATPSEKKESKTVADKIKQDGLPVFVAMVIYNAVQVALCGWMVYAAVAEHRRRGFGIVCNPFVYSEDGMASVLHVFYLSKILDFFDTAFMIVKGNWRQVSFLHVYHHASIFLIYWLNTQTNFDGDIYFTVVLNSGIHFIMYGYYLVTCFNVRVPVFIKKAITNAQLLQFCCMETQGAVLMLGGCDTPVNVTILYMVYISTMLALFLDFKRRTYLNAKKSAKMQAEAEKAKLLKSKEKDDERSDSESTVASESELVFNCCNWPIAVPKAPKRKVKDVVAMEQDDEKEDARNKSEVIKDVDGSDAAPAEQGVNEVLIDGRFYDVSNFKHPGGTILNFFKGSGDASTHFKEFHMRSRKAPKVLASLPSRPCPAAALANMMHAGKQQLGEDFLKLHEQLKVEGFFEPHLSQIVFRIMEVVMMFGSGFYLLLCCQSTALRGVGLVVLGLVEGRCGWLMHEGGHGSLTGRMSTDRNLQVLFYGLGCGMSAGWWRSQHNKHHAAPQKLKHDADLDTLPLVAFNAAVTKGIRSPILAAWLRAQAYLFMPLTCLLVVLGWQVFLHPRYMMRTSKWSELAMLIVRYYLTFAWVFSGYSWLSAVACYLFVQQIAGSYIFTNFALSHTHLDVTQPDEHIHWVEYASSHTTNLSNHWFVNWWMAYLNFQIEHHLFPTMPQFRHPIVSKRVRSLFEKHGLHYDVRGYFSCLGDTLKNLDDVGSSKADTQHQQQKKKQ